MPRQKHHRDRVYQVLGQPGPGARVAGYARYSSEMQDPATIVTQKRRIQEYCDKMGWALVRWYEEPERSAKYESVEERPVFAQLLADAGNEYQAVVCYQNNRWSRNTGVAFTSLSQLRRKRVWWATSDGMWDIDKVQQDGFDVAFAVDTQMNTAYVRQLSKRTIDAKEDRARDGYHNGQVMFGYQPPEYPKAPDGAPSTWKPPRTPVRTDPENFPALVRLGELVAQGWSDAAIGDELAGYFSQTPRFGIRSLAKDSVAAIRRTWFPREFAPGSGPGTIETPSGELIEGRHQAAWPYELWQRMVEVKRGQYRRPQTQRPSQRQPREFSRIIVCAACRRPLRVTTAHSNTYYKDTSLVRHLPCSDFGCLSVTGARVSQQFGDLLHSITLPTLWREAVSQRCQDTSGDDSAARILARRADLEAEQTRLVTAFTKGYLAESDLDMQVERIRAELLTLPTPQTRDTADFTQAAISAGETLADMAGYWDEALPEEQRDMVWALLTLGGIVYDLQRQGIVGLIPRPDMLPVLALGLNAHWEQREDGLWLRDEFHAAYTARVQAYLDTPPYRAHKLTAAQREQALQLIQAGQSPQQVAEQFGVSYWVIFRLIKRDNPAALPATRQRKLTPEQCDEARAMVRQGMTLRQVGAHFRVSYGAIWRLLQQDRWNGKNDEKGGKRVKGG